MVAGTGAGAIRVIHLAAWIPPSMVIGDSMYKMAPTSASVETLAAESGFSECASICS